MGRRVHTDIAIRGVVYPDTRTASAALGVARRTLLAAIRLNRLDRVGLGRGRKARMPVEIRGVRYRDAHHAAACLKVGVSAVYQGLHRGDPDSVGARAFHRVPGNAIAVEIGPCRFASRAEASRALGFSSGYVSAALRGGSPHRLQRVLAAAMRLADKSPAFVSQGENHGH